MGYDREKRKTTMRNRSMDYDRVMPRLIGKVDTWGESCWEFQGVRTKKGYGRLHYGGREVFAHRLSYQLLIDDIPDGKFVLHKCDNPPCINPGHLWIGTTSDNLQDAGNKNRLAHQRIRTLYCKQGHFIAGDNVMIVKRNERIYKTCKICRRETVQRCRANKQIEAELLGKK